MIDSSTPTVSVSPNPSVASASPEIVDISVSPSSATSKTSSVPRMPIVTVGVDIFTLAFGSASATPVALPITSMVPDYKSRAELKLPEATVGAVTSGPPASQWEKLVEDVSPRKIALWTILIAGVVVLGFMAWRLLR